VYLGNDVVGIQEKLTRTASPIKEVSG